MRTAMSPNLFQFNFFSTPSLCFSPSTRCYFDLISSPLSFTQLSSPLILRLSSQPFLHFSFSQLVSSPIAFQFLGPLLISFPHFSPLHSCSSFFSCARPSHLFALVSSLLHCQELLYTEQRVITFVLHRVSLIGFMPPSFLPPPQKKRLKLFCHV